MGSCSGRSNKLRAQRVSENACLQQASLCRRLANVASSGLAAQRNGDGPHPSRARNAVATLNTEDTQRYNQKATRSAHPCPGFATPEEDYSFPAIFALVRASVTNAV